MVYLLRCVSQHCLPVLVSPTLGVYFGMYFHGTYVIVSAVLMSVY
jgi:hypothetical protein